MDPDHHAHSLVQNRRGTIRLAGLLGLLAVSVASATVARADGTLPPEPYNYLHPPSALADTNTLPSSGAKVVRVVGGKSAEPFNAFTLDGQAGFSALTGAFLAPPLSTHLQVRIIPVDVPAGLPSGLAADGNAYSLSVVGRSRPVDADLSSSVGVVLRWPHAPTAVYVYRSGVWQQACAAPNWTVSATTVLCRVTALGTFLSVSPTAGSAGIRGARAPAIPHVPLPLSAAMVTLTAVMVLVFARRRL